MHEEGTGLCAWSQELPVRRRQMVVSGYSSGIRARPPNVARRATGLPV